MIVPASIVRRPWEQRAAPWQRWATAVLLAAYVALLAVTLRDSLEPVTLGITATWTEAKRAWIITEVKPTSLAQDAGIRAGDVLLLVDGRPLPPDEARGRAALAQAAQVSAQRPATGATFTTAGQGRELRVPNGTAYLFLGVIFFVVGAVALCWGRGRAPRALALVCCVGAGELTWLQAVYRQASWALILHGFYVPLFLGGFAYLFLVFPSQRQLRIGRWTLRPEHILVPALPIGVGWNILVFLADDSASLLMVIRWLGYLYFLGCLLGGSAALLYNWWGTQGRRARRQLRLVSFGTLCAVLPFLLLSLLPQAAFERVLVPPDLTLLALGLMPAAFGYAILRYQLMDLQLYIRRGVLYATLAAIVTGVYALSLAAATLFVQDRTRAGIAMAVLSAVIAIAGQSLRDFLRHHIDRLFDRRRYDYRQQLLEFSQRMSGMLDPDELARSTTELIAQTMGAYHVCLYLYEPNGQCYHLWSAVGLEAPPENHTLGLYHPLLQELAVNGETIQHFDVAPEEEALVIAMKYKGQPIGLLTLGPKRADLPYSSEDLSLLRTVANQLAISTENAQLYGRMRDLYLASIRSLAATVDAKDSYTHGHSERVAAYARQIASALRLPQLKIETIELAALLHDIGKIGIPDKVLLKTGRLDPDEWQIMMRHAELGADILAGNPALAPLVPLVRHHHERYNGTGYPDRLAGEAIPLGAAIIAVADTFDTMTTDRPYRKAPGWEAARDEIERCTGTQFHPGVVGAFLQAVRRPEWRGWPTETRVTAFGARPLVPTAGAGEANGHDLNLVARAMTLAGE